jgi:hypothetical protein
MSIAIQHFSMHGFYFNTRFLFQRGHGMPIFMKNEHTTSKNDFCKTAKVVLFTV